jgi:Gly-Xaa carboxypeptidase
MKEPVYDLGIDPNSVRAEPRWPRLTFVLATLALGALLYPGVAPLTSTVYDKQASYDPAQVASASALGCDQAEPLYPSFNTSSLVATPEQHERLINWLSGAVKVPTEVFDVMGEIGEDPRWDVFTDFANCKPIIRRTHIVQLTPSDLRDAFPRVHDRLTVTHVHMHGLVYEWAGADSGRKPLLLTAHQDVVPVEPSTVSQWSHAPFGGELADGRIWGRGATDDKSGLVGSLAAVELLLERGFVPARTVILALGYDEEAAGRGAGYLSEWLEAKYGADSMAMLVDEGNGLAPMYGQMFAVPAVAEKGYLDAEVRVETRGGHSSVPPPHTGIGLLALAVEALEENPYAPELPADSPLVDFVACAARYAPETPASLRKAVAKVVASRDTKSGVDKKALARVLDWFTSGAGALGPIGRALVSTTQAVDLVYGGVKANALPEVATAVVNHRVSIASRVADVQAHMIRVLKPVAREYGLALEAWGEEMLAGTAGKIILREAYGSLLETAPISPFTTESAAWRLLAGTTKATWATRPGAKGDEVHMAPLMSTGNTDTKNYWNLTENIVSSNPWLAVYKDQADKQYRFAYLAPNVESYNIHTVDEFIEVDAFVEQVRWFLNLILNVDASRDV